MKAAALSQVSLILKENIPSVNSFPSFLPIVHKLDPNLSPIQDVLQDVEKSSLFLPEVLFRWWCLLDYGCIQDIADWKNLKNCLREVVPKRLSFCFLEFSLWGLIQIHNALNKGRFIEAEAHLVFLIQMAEKIGAPRHWALEEAETALEAGFLLRRLKILKERKGGRD